MELNAVHGVMPMTNGHDRAVLTPGVEGDAGGQGRRIGREGVVAHRFEGARQSVEDAFVLATASLTLDATR